MLLFDRCALPSLGDTQLKRAVKHRDLLTSKDTGAVQLFLTSETLLYRGGGGFNNGGSLPFKGSPAVEQSLKECRTWFFILEEARAFRVHTISSVRTVQPDYKVMRWILKQVLTFLFGYVRILAPPPPECKNIFRNDVCFCIVRERSTHSQTPS